MHSDYKSQSKSLRASGSRSWSVNARHLASTAMLVVAVAMAPSLGAAEDKTTLVFSHPQEPPNWNYWATGASALSVATFMNIQQPLVETLGDGSAGPLLAESWTISDDGLEYVFKLREAKFHDGSDFDAADVIYSLEKNMESPQAKIKTPLAPIASMEAVDARTVKLTLSHPSQRLLKELGLAAGIIVPEGMHENHDINVEMIGTGPYVFGEYRPDVSLQLTRFEDYWGEKPFFVDVTERFIPDETAAINALLAGEIDMVASVFGEGLDRIGTVSEDDRFKTIIPAPFETNYIFLNPRVEAFQDDRVRQAIAHGVDREIILEGAQAGYGKVTCQWVVPFTEPWNSDYCPYPYDPAKSRELLAEAGQTGLTLDFPFITVAEHPVIKDILEVQMADAGITLDIRALDLATWLEQVNTNSDYEFSNLTSNVNAEAYICGGGRQPLGRPDSPLCDEEFDRMVLESDAIVDDAEYLDAMKAMTARFAESAWVIPIHAKSTPTLTRAELTGLKGYRFRIEMDLRNLHWTE